VVVHVEHKVLAHHRQPDQSNIAIRFRHPAYPRSNPQEYMIARAGSKNPGSHGFAAGSMTTFVLNPFTVSAI
jgi:hypothetical protein